MAYAFDLNKYSWTVAAGRKRIIHAPARVAIFRHDLRRITIVPTERAKNGNDDAGRNGAFVRIEPAVKASTYAIY
ncbi:hypothetical protein EAH87_13220 [Sphingomonas koreensis]|nr:hypothetical protein EAH87_13220 [Sphingomonas koreensis]